MQPDLSPDDIVALNRLTVIARVLAGTAHEVNNALQIIGGSAEHIEAQPDLTDSARRALQRIQAQSRRAAGAVADVMRFARERNERPVSTPLRDSVVKAVALRLFLIRRAGLVFDFDAAASPVALVHGRPPQLQLAVLNLIMNAEQALAGLADGAIHVAIEVEGAHAVVRVEDNGPGIDLSVRDSLFEPFVTTRLRADAPGLGLTAARIIARTHGGDVSFETRPSGCCACLRVALASS
ncbi:MAG: sensor histidine kinase [Acidobacteriota bacterium]